MTTPIERLEALADDHIKPHHSSLEECIANCCEDRGGCCDEREADTELRAIIAEIKKREEVYEAAMMKREDWIWMAHPAHFICAQWCRFHIATYVGGYIVSSVGEYWPERPSREIHAKIHDPKWLRKNHHLKGDNFDAAYMERFGFQAIGYDYTYETMVFKAVPAPEPDSCCPWRIESGENIDGATYKDSDAAMAWHMKLCEKWAKRAPNKGRQAR